MRDDTVVEFLEDDPAPDPGPVAPGRAHRSVPPRGALVALGVVTAGAVAVVATRSLQAGGPSSAAPQTRQVVGVTVPAPTPPIPLHRPVPPLALLPTPTCPGGCAVLSWVADAALGAIASAFPGSTVDEQMTAFGPTPAGAAHPLLAREVTVRAGRSRVVIDVVQAPYVSHDVVRVEAHGDVVQGFALGPGYRVAVRISHADAGSLKRVYRLLADPGLMAVR